MYVRRKVFSNVEQPVEEQLYSVTMTEEEYNLFSEFLEEREYASKEDKKEVAKGAAKGAAATAGAAGLAVGGALGANKLAGKLQAKRVAAAEKEGLSLVGPGKVEKALRNAGLTPKQAVEWAKKNKKNKLVAGGIAAGALAAGTAAGAGIAAAKNKKK